MAEDRFGDLGPDRRSAAERFAELDARGDEEAREGPPEPRDPRSYSQRYMWVVGVAALIVIIIVTINSAGNPGRGYLGPKPGTSLPPFAAKAAASGTAGDANVRPETGGNATQGPVPACQVKGPDVVNICELWDKPVVVTFVADGFQSSEQCREAFAVVEEVKAQSPGVNFVGVISGVDSPEEAKALATAGDWTFPIASDPDAAVFNVYRAGDCPSTVLASAGGTVSGTRLGPLTAGELAVEVAKIEQEDHRAGG
jgi:hypothetical protein